MNQILMSTEFIGFGQDLSLGTRGNKYGVSLTQGGYKYNGTPQGDLDFECATSPNFNSYDDAFAFYSACLREFGRGDYNLSDRLAIVAKGELI